jgi:hypothetical protein
MFDHSWLGYGIVGALEIGAIALVVGFALYALLQAIKRNASHGVLMGWSWLVSTALVGAVDFKDIFYFNFSRFQSIQLLRLQLAEVHDPDAIGLRCFFVMVGAIVGVGLAWAIFSLAFWRRRGDG